MRDPSNCHAGLSCRHILSGGAGLVAAAQGNCYGSNCESHRAVACRLADGFAVIVS